MAQPVRGFCIHSESYYAKTVSLGLSVIDQVTFGMYYDEGGCDFELSASWINLGPGDPALKINIFEDAFIAFVQFSDVFKTLSILHKKNPTKDQFVNILNDLGFRDMTIRENPNKKKEKIRKLELED